MLESIDSANRENQKSDDLVSNLRCLEFTHEAIVANLLLIAPGNRIAVQRLPITGSHLQFDVLLLCDRYELQGKGPWRCVNGGFGGSGVGKC